MSTPELKSFLGTKKLVDVKKEPSLTICPCLLAVLRGCTEEARDLFEELIKLFKLEKSRCEKVARAKFEKFVTDTEADLKKYRGQVTPQMLRRAYTLSQFLESYASWENRKGLIKEQWDNARVIWNDSDAIQHPDWLFYHFLGDSAYRPDDPKIPDEQLTGSLWAARVYRIVFPYDRKEAA